MYEKNHTIPKCQQKFFADENECVRSFDVIKQQYQTFGGSLEIPLLNAAQKLNYWEKEGLDPEIMEKHLSFHESRFEAVANEIINGNGDCSSEHDRKIISDWVSSRVILNRFYVYATYRSVLNMIKWQEDRMIQFLEAGVSEQFIFDFHKEILTTDPTFSNPKVATYDMIMRAMKTHAVSMMYVNKPIWNVIRISEDKFITSDKTIVEIPLHNYKDNVDNFITLSPKVCIHISNYTLPFNIKDLYLNNDYLVDVINNDLRECSHFWIHNKNYEVRQTKANAFLQCFLGDLAAMNSKGVAPKDIKKFIYKKIEEYYDHPLNDITDTELQSILDYLDKI